MTYLTVKQLARSSGISVRTLHHYHEIGLLPPALIGGNGYRYYGQDEALRLQQILFWREFGMSLAEIAAVLDSPDFDPIGALETHRSRLTGEAKRIRDLLRTIDRTIEVMNGERQMKIDELYRGFAPEKQREYEAWLKERFGRDADISDSRTRWEQHGTAMMQALRPIEAELVELHSRQISPDDIAAAPALERHRAWISESWGRDCSLSAYAGLADVYEHEDFRARFETLKPGFSDWLIAAMRAHTQRQE